MVMYANISPKPILYLTEAFTKSRDMSWASGALRASSWMLNDEKRLMFIECHEAGDRGRTGA